MSSKAKRPHPGRYVPGGYGSGGVIRGTGQVIRVDNVRSIDDVPSDAKGHVWLGIVTYRIADPAVAAAGEQLFDAENVVEAHIGCFRCERSYTPDVAATRCFDAAP